MIYLFSIFIGYFILWLLMWPPLIILELVATHTSVSSKIHNHPLTFFVLYGLEVWIFFSLFE